MKYDKYDTIHIMMKRYSIKILKALKGTPLRFSDLRSHVSNPKTLSVNLTRLLEYGLIEVESKKIGYKYSNFYRLSNRGLKILRAIEQI